MEVSCPRELIRGVVVLLALGQVSCQRRAGAEPSQRAVPFQRGVSYAHIHRLGHGYGSAISARQIGEIKRRLGASWLALMPFAYQRKVTDDRLFGYTAKVPGRSGFFGRHDATLTDRHLEKEIAAAHARGVSVTLKPHVWSSDFWGGKQWHGTIRQLTAAAHRSWWRDYCAYILHYARLAARTKVAQYVVGTELVQQSTRHEAQWRALIADVRKVYRGRLTYAAHWDREAFEIRFWDALDVVGVNAYFPLRAKRGADEAELRRAWAPHRARLAALARRVKRPVVFLEAGYRPVVGTHEKPWVHRGKALDLTAQRRALAAMFSAFASTSWWRGVYLWKLYTDPRLRYEKGTESFSVLGRPAEAVVLRWYGSRKLPK